MQYQFVKINKVSTENIFVSKFIWTTMKYLPTEINKNKMLNNTSDKIKENLFFSKK